MTHIKVEPEEPASLQHALSQCAPKAEVVPNQKEPELSLAALEALSNDADVSKLEKAIEVGHGVLDDIKKAFATAAKAPEISSWIQSAEKLQAQAKMSRAVIGVVGVTGAGKSSIINAVLDEECLVPTNCMRACTAVITEIAYNHDSDEKIPYRAEIHFIKEDEWTAELQIMLDELAQANGIVGPEDTEAGIAYSKVRSVYPHLQLKDLTKGKYTAQGLANNPNSKAFLGTVIEISASTVDSFHQQLKQYIDSKDKNSKENGVMEYWPLIKVVKLFIKCSVLESGLVLVDLVSSTSCRILIYKSRLISNPNSLAYKTTTRPDPPSRPSTWKSAPGSGWWLRFIGLSMTRLRMISSVARSGASCSSIPSCPM